MKLIRYVEIENFKRFEDKLRVDLSHPAVLVGPNNAGKTSVIQALALWSRGVIAWYDRKGQARQKESRERLSAGINRLNILEVPVSETRLLWSNTRVRKGNTPIYLTITVGVEHEGIVKPCTLEFSQRDNEVIYCKPSPETLTDETLIAHATRIPFHLLYPMSGIETEEPLIQEGRINVLLGQGQTAQVLRNLCYRVTEQDEKEKNHDWNRIADLVGKLFGVELHKPTLNESRGNVELFYTQPGVDRQLDVSVAGRGFQQMLLILAYMFSHKKSVLMVDEPDAHLEVLRQKQVYEILKDVADENGCQVIVATHSEVILDDAVETNLTLLINGRASDLARRREIKDALRTFSIDHYYKAFVCPRLIYVEGSTDFDNLRALASKLEHPAHDLLTGRINYYYTRNIHPAESLENRLERAGGAYQEDMRRHFYAMKGVVPEFRAVAIMDGDGGSTPDKDENGLLLTCWKHYEIENYFISPESILRYIRTHFDEEGGLFTSSAHDTMAAIIDKYLLDNVFDHDKTQLQEYKKSSTNLRRTLLRNIKMSALADYAFTAFAEQQKQPVLLRKGEYYRIVAHAELDDIPVEVTEKLDLLVERLSDREVLRG